MPRQILLVDIQEVVMGITMDIMVDIAEELLITITIIIITTVVHIGGYQVL
jgi:hypothetical protein